MEGEEGDGVDMGRKEQLVFAPCPSTGKPSS